MPHCGSGPAPDGTDRAGVLCRRSSRSRLRGSKFTPWHPERGTPHFFRASPDDSPRPRSGQGISEPATGTLTPAVSYEATSLTLRSTPVATTKAYESDGVVIHFEARRCIHAAECVRGLPGVFDADRRPWIDATAGTVEDIVRTVELCPSGALTYERRDGGPAEVVQDRRGSGPSRTGHSMCMAPVTCPTTRGTRFRRDRAWPCAGVARRRTNRSATTATSRSTSRTPDEGPRGEGPQGEGPHGEGSTENGSTRAIRWRMPGCPDGGAGGPHGVQGDLRPAGW